ncbi:amino acid ABC transporter substrate-binding protein [Kurthia sibirica]|uniref:Amino acid ABC transporter substrate-binding protein n=1 Tax=Kurthia sibirica TaxID=202750 RepID=A0A2U3APD4_9BACL|nr:amino acid ABC transporter substrate-binding protein [Kurthia sibirica]PWI26402.1 amino acid ABC transporter substrate-binding protein [Kurthia sibirica]GEK34161.1 amino acid ABC transporter substrate-binding protein [Kurthia sibirica]
MKKLSFLFVTILVFVGVLAGCSSSDSSKDKAKELVVGVDDQFAPMGFRDEDNKLVGFDIDYAKAAAKEMGYTIKFQPIDWSTKEAELQSGRIDLIWNGYTITDDRKKKVLFTKPYLENAQVVVTKADSTITSLADLKGKKVGLQAQSSAAEALDANAIKNDVKNVSEYKDNVTALNDLKTGRTDAVIIDEVVIDYYMKKDADSYKTLVESLAPEQYGVGVKKGNDDVLKKLQKALDTLNDNGKAQEISEKWFGTSKVLN